MRRQRVACVAVGVLAGVLQSMAVATMARAQTPGTLCLASFNCEYSQPHATYVVKTPEGETYHVKAPADMPEAEVLARFKSHMGLRNGPPTAHQTWTEWGVGVALLAILAGASIAVLVLVVLAYKALFKWLRAVS